MARTLAGSELERRGLDPHGFRAIIDGGGHGELKIKAATEAAPELAMGSWTLHISERDTFATCDVPILFDYTAAPAFDVAENADAGRRWVARTAPAGASPDRARAGLLTAPGVLVPLAPTALLEIVPDGRRRTQTVVARHRIDREHRRLLVRCRDRVVVGTPGSDLVTGSRPKVSRRRQLALACVSTELADGGGTCVQRLGSVYAKEPEIELCVNHH